MFLRIFVLWLWSYYLRFCCIIIKHSCSPYKVQKTPHASLSLPIQQCNMTEVSSGKGPKKLVSAATSNIMSQSVHDKLQFYRKTPQGYTALSIRAMLFKSFCCFFIRRTFWPLPEISVSNFNFNDNKTLVMADCPIKMIHFRETYHY